MKTTKLFHLILTGFFSVALFLNSNAQWSLTGNAGTNPNNNFLGTTDNKALVFRTNNSERMRIKQNGFVGIGNTNPQSRLDVNGDINLSGKIKNFGLTILSSDETFGNLFLGQNAGSVNSGSSNTCLGVFAGSLVTVGSGNTFIGTEAGGKITTGGGNTFMGNLTGRKIGTSGGRTVIIGANTGSNATSSDENVWIGYDAALNTIDAAQSTVVGNRAGYNMNGGVRNSFYGHQAGFSNTGSENTFLGAEAGQSNTEGVANVAIGRGSCTNQTLNDGNTYVGTYTDASVNDLSGSTALGYGATITASNQVRIGDDDVTSIGGFANWTNLSDKRYKKNIKEDVPGILFIEKLQPVTYNLDITGLNIFLRPDLIDDEIKNEGIPAKEAIRYTGFLAQDVEAAARELGYDFSGVDAPKNDKDLYGLRYAEFVVPLVKAVQEQQAMIDEKDQKISSLQSTVAELQAKMEIIEQALPELQLKNVALKVSSETGKAILYQNAPNPFDQSTTISFYLPESAFHASVEIISAKGEVIRSIPVSGTGKGQVTLKSGELIAGTYTYQLVINGKAFDSKQMVVVH